MAKSGYLTNSCLVIDVIFRINGQLRERFHTINLADFSRYQAGVIFKGMFSYILMGSTYYYVSATIPSQITPHPPPQHTHARERALGANLFFSDLFEQTLEAIARTRSIRGPIYPYFKDFTLGIALLDTVWITVTLPQKSNTYDVNARILITTYYSSR